MTSRSEFQQLAVDIFDSFGDVVENATLRRHSSAYTLGGAVTDTVTAYPVRVVREALTAAEIAAGIALQGDYKFITPASELAIEPRAKDSILLADGTILNVYAVEGDAADAAWILFARS